MPRDDYKSKEIKENKIPLFDQLKVKEDQKNSIEKPSMPEDSLTMDEAELRRRRLSQDIPDKDTE